MEKRSVWLAEGRFVWDSVEVPHRLNNDGREPVLALAETNAPIIMDQFHNPKFIFECDFRYRSLQWIARLLQSHRGHRPCRPWRRRGRWRHDLAGDLYTRYVQCDVFHTTFSPSPVSLFSDVAKYIAFILSSMNGKISRISTFLGSSWAVSKNPQVSSTIVNARSEDLDV